jgi:thioredoxin-like negative regulator of GroEL
MTGGLSLSFAEARRRKAENPRARWSQVAGDFAGDVWPDLRPSFRLRPGQTVFTIGSCFARNIEQHLATLGCRVPMLELNLPPEETGGAANGALNRFHPPSFRQTLAWAAAIRDRDGRVTWPDCEPLAFDLGGERLFDLDIDAAGGVTRARFVQRRQHIYDIVSQAFEAECLMMTPGLIEAWRDRATGLYIHEAPLQKAMLAHKDRWEFQILAYEQCLADLLAAIDVVRARNRDVKVLVTTSPVPLSATFSGVDIRIANAESKAVLRAACGAASRQRPCTDYFPSYESATLSRPDAVWDSDRLHVSQSFVGKIVGRMLSTYLEGVDAAAAACQRARVLFEQGAFAEAEAAAAEALAADPERLEARMLQAEALLRLYRCAEAETAVRALLEAHGERADLWLMLARAISRGPDAGRRAAEAIACVRKALFLPTVTAGQFRAVAGLVRRRADPETAERLMRRGVELFPLHVQVYPPLAAVLLDQGRKAEAAGLLRRAIGLKRAGPELRLQLADLLAEAGERAQARTVLETLLALEPGHEEARRRLAALDAPEPAPSEGASSAGAGPWAALLRRLRPRRGEGLGLAQAASLGSLVRDPQVLDRLGDGVEHRRQL